MSLLSFFKTNLKHIIHGFWTCTMVVVLFCVGKLKCKSKHIFVYKNGDDRLSCVLVLGPSGEVLTSLPSTKSVFHQLNVLHL